MGGLGKGAPPSGASGPASSWEDYLALEVPRLSASRVLDSRTRVGAPRTQKARHGAAAGRPQARAARAPVCSPPGPAVAMARLLAVSLGCILLLYLSLPGTMSRRQGGSRRLALPR